MSGPFPAMSVVVVGDDPVASGMLALDLVQAGVAAHAASDEFAVLDTLVAARDDGSLSQCAVVAAFDDIGRINALWQRLQLEQIAVRYVAAVRARDVALAEHEAVRHGWVAVLERPLQAAALGDALRKPPQAARRREQSDGEIGDVGLDPLPELLGRLIAAADRGGPRDVVVRLQADERDGELALVDGELVHAVAGSDSGRHALERMFCWRRGVWRLVHGRHVGARTLGSGWRGTIAAATEYCRRVEESRLSVPFQHEICQVRWERVRPLPPVAEPLFRRIAAGIPLGDALDGEGDDELEAFAALLSRLGRGAVLPREGAVRSPASRHVAARTGAFATTPANIRSHSAAFTGRTASGSFAARSSRASLMASSASAGWSRATPQGGADLPSVSSAPMPSTPHHRHSQTSQYQPGTHALDPGAAASGSVLPRSLPESLPIEAPPPVHALAGRAHQPSTRSAGWFGVNMHQDGVSSAARTTTVGQVLVTPPLEPPPQEATAALAPVVYERQVAAAHAPSLDDWTERHAEAEQRVMAPTTPERGRRPNVAVWGTIGAVAAVAVLILLLPVFSPDGAVRDQDHGPVRDTHRRAIALVDSGQKHEALALLRLIHASRGLAPEATLELAVLEIEVGRAEIGQRLLHQYTLEPGALHVEAARRLYARLFADDLAPL